MKCCAILLLATGGCTGELGKNGYWGTPGAAGNSAGAAGDGDGDGEPGGDGDGDRAPNPKIENPDIAPTTFDCQPEVAGDSPPLRRLTRTQYVSTVLDVVARALEGEPSVAEEVQDGLREEFAQLDQDVRVELEGTHSSYRRLDQTVQQAHVDAWYAIGRRTGELLSTPERLPVLLGDCAETTGSQAQDCIERLISRLGRLALRRPLRDEEVEFYGAFYEPSTGIDPAGIVDVVTGLLSAPEFLYLVEHGEDALDAPRDSFRLGAHELASRLSYHFWNTTPDGELSDLADSGDLLDDEIYREQVERLWVDQRTHETITQFYLEWLGLEDLPELDRNNEANVFRNFAGDNLPSAGLREDMIQEAVDLMNYYTWDRPSGLQEIFLTPHSFARSSELAEIYGVEPWDGSSDPPEMPGERPGLLTRAAFLSTGTANTRPIMKGLFIRTNVLCDHIPPPPENANAMPPDLSPDLTTREVVEALTGSPGCAHCHDNFINPLGFPTEAFDSLGRAREEQQLFDEQGEPIGNKPVDTQSVPQVILGDTSTASGPAELMELVAGSGKIEACFARHYFRFSFGRQEGVQSDACVLEEMRSALEESGSLADMLRAVALSDAFRSRTFVPQDPQEEM